MAFALKGTGSATTTISDAVNQATFVITTVTTAGAAGDLAVLCYAVDNAASADGDEGAVTGIVDSAGNDWRKAVEFTNAQTGAQLGATCGMWFCDLKRALPTSSTITLSYTNATSRDRSAANLTYFTKAANRTVAIEGTPGTLATDAAALPGSLDVTTASIACLRIRATASEHTVATAWTKTAAFTAVFTQAITGGTTAAAQAIRAEYLISTSTGQASAPTGPATNCDHASVYVAFKEVTVAPPPFSRHPKFWRY